MEEVGVQALALRPGTTLAHCDIHSLVPRRQLYVPPLLTAGRFFKQSPQSFYKPKCPFNKQLSRSFLFPLSVMHFFFLHAICKAFDISPHLIIAFIMDHANLSVLICLKTCICQHKPFYFLYVDTKISHIDFCVALISCKLSKQ